MVVPHDARCHFKHFCSYNCTDACSFGAWTGWQLTLFRPSNVRKTRGYSCSGFLLISSAATLCQFREVFLTQYYLFVDLFCKAHSNPLVNFRPINLRELAAAQCNYVYHSSHKNFLNSHSSWTSSESGQGRRFLQSIRFTLHFVLLFSAAIFAFHDRCVVWWVTMYLIFHTAFTVNFLDRKI